MKTTDEKQVGEYMDRLITKLKNHKVPFDCVHWSWVGSTYINGAGNDVDIIVYVKPWELRSGIREVVWSDVGLEFGGSQPFTTGDSWVSTSDSMGTNVIFVEDEKYYDLWVSAAEVCRQLVMWGVPLDKFMRVRLHSIIMDEAEAV